MGFTKIFSNSWDLYWKNSSILMILTFVLSVIPSILVTIFATSSQVAVKDRFVTVENIEQLSSYFASYISIWMLVAILVAVLGFILSLCLINYVKEKDKGKTLDFMGAISGGLKHFWPGLALTIVITIIFIFLSLLLLIPFALYPTIGTAGTVILTIICALPLIYLGILWSFALYALVMEDTGIMASINRSKELVAKRWWTVFGYMLLFTIILGLIGMVVGLISLAIFGTPTTYVSAGQYTINKTATIGQNVLTALMTLFTVPFSIIFMKKFYDRLNYLNNPKEKNVPKKIMKKKIVKKKKVKESKSEF
ncbi:glycerophosphoryl diester phosphodiesterase membrane domain-containing protein [Nanoarchaeota archaeon]